MSLCIALSGASMVTTMAQSKFHVDLDYHYNLGLSTKKFGHTYGRSDYDMGGHSLRLGARYDVAEKWSVGGGIGLDRYTNDDYNTMPIYATLRYKHQRRHPDANILQEQRNTPLALVWCRRYILTNIYEY